MRNRRPMHESGFVLITSLIFLVAITIAVVYGVRSATMRERIAGNDRAHSQAFQMAELAMTRAQGRLVDEVLFPGSGTCANGLCHKDTPDSTMKDRASWLPSSDLTCAIDSNSCNTTKGSNPTQTAYVSGIAIQPRWAIRDITQPSGAGATGCTFYEVWSHGVGSNADSSVLLRSIVKACES